MQCEEEPGAVEGMGPARGGRLADRPALLVEVLSELFMASGAFEESRQAVRERRGGEPSRDRTLEGLDRALGFVEVFL